MSQSVELTAKTGLCSSCGICKNICPKNCISIERIAGKYQPVVDTTKCVKCGICVKCCPGMGMNYEESEFSQLQAIYGKCLEMYNAWSRNETLRHVAASGGVVTTLVKTLLEEQVYDVAFCVDSYSYDKQLYTKPISKDDLLKDWNQSNIPKSRYLPVSHENAVEYIKTNVDKRIILIGTSCAIRGLRKVVSHLHLKQERFLMIGLFCDKVFNYNVNQYYSDRFADGKKIQALHFKNKESGGWPGNMKLFFQDGSSSYLDKNERAKVKDYFMPERCLYCVDKLNIEADISLGDNYTGKNSSVLGSNSVVIRTEQGLKAWNTVKSKMEFYSIDIESIRKAQYLDGRLNNLYYGDLKERQISKKYGIKVQLNKGIKLVDDPNDYEQAWRNNLAKLRAGEVYNKNPKELDRQIKLVQRRANSKSLRGLCERVYYAIRRRIK